MLEKIKEYLTFTRKERMGVVVLVIIILTLFIVPYWIRRPPGTEDPEATRQFAPLIETMSKDSIVGNGSANEMRIDGTLRASRADASVAGNDRRPAKLFYFDPNVLQESDWQRLGLSERQSRTIVHYTAKGGRFRTGEDLGKIYGLSDADRHRLMPFVRISGSVSDGYRRNVIARNHTDANRAGLYKERSTTFVRSGKPWISEKRSSAVMPDSSKFTGFPPRYPRKIPAIIDINRAGSEDWQQLPGIGEKLASRIVRFREKLGGFYSVEQVAETFGLADSTFEKIRPWLQPDSSSIQHINLNTVTEAALREHPYVRWKLAGILLRYRDQHGGFQSVDDLNQIALLDRGTLQKLRPYLDLSK